MSRSRQRPLDRRAGHAGGPAFRAVPADAVDPTEAERLRDLVGEWLTLPDVAEQTGLDIMRVRRLVQDGDLAATRIDGVQRVPALLLVPADAVRAGGGRVAPEGTTAQAVPLPDLRGTLTLLADAGYTLEEALTWLFTPDATLPEGRPVDTMRAGRKTEIRRRAQALGF